MSLLETRQVCFDKSRGTSRLAEVEYAAAYLEVFTFPEGFSKTLTPAPGVMHAGSLPDLVASDCFDF